MAFIRKSVSLKETEINRADARKLPVVLLIDVSGSMNEIIDREGMVRTGQYIESDGQQWEEVRGGRAKIEILNRAMSEMLESFKNTHSLQAEIYCHIITFGNKAEHFVQFAPAGSIEWQDIKCEGDTDMAGAFRLVTELIDDKEKIDSRAYRPLVVLVSDGKPDRESDWSGELNRLLTSRSGKADRLALAIGDGESVDMEVLKTFVSKSAGRVFSASEAREIFSFFKMVTMTTQQRTVTNSSSTIPSYDDIYDSID